jgi:hypothetical protein
MMFFKPTSTRLIITMILLLIAYGGYVQSEAFTEKDPGQRALPLAPLFERIPHLWELWVLLLAPLALTLRLAGVEELFNTGPVWLFSIFQVLYFYLLSGAVVFFWNNLVRRRSTVGATNPQS